MSTIRRSDNKNKLYIKTNIKYRIKISKDNIYWYIYITLVMMFIFKNDKIIILYQTCKCTLSVFGGWEKGECPISSFGKSRLNSVCNDKIIILCMKKVNVLYHVFIRQISVELDHGLYRVFSMGLVHLFFVLYEL